jgi:2-polyprenyl-3-methyl-5-hydroxy-6-metoxy-1,4-benzoquinol methylase
MSSERYTPESWRRQYSPVSNWDETFRNRQWDRLGDLSQASRHAVVAGYAHKLKRGGRILDAGCGEGVLIDFLDATNIEYAGFDISPTAIGRALERYPKMRLFHCSIEEFTPPDNEQYDQVIFNDSLASLANPIETIDRFAPYLRPSGHIVVSQFQPIDPNANGAIFTRMFEAEIEAGRYSVIVKTEVANLSTGQRWRSYCLAKSSARGKS